MLTPFNRIILILLSSYLSYYLYLDKEYTILFITLIAIVIIIVGYFRYGTVYKAFRQINNHNIGKAEKSISKVKFPNFLSKKHKAYYHYIKGNIELFKSNFDISYDEFQKSLNIGLRTENDTAIAYYYLASIEYERDNIKEVKEYLEKLKPLDYKNELEESIKNLEKKLES